MVSIGAKDKYEGGVSHELHVHSLESDDYPIGNHNGVVGIPCVNVGTVAEQTGTKEVGM
jgi:hypothetical protein